MGSQNSLEFIMGDLFDVSALAQILTYPVESEDLEKYELTEEEYRATIVRVMRDKIDDYEESGNATEMYDPSQLRPVPPASEF